MLPKQIHSTHISLSKKHFYNYNQCILKNIIKKLFAKLLTFSRNDAYFSQLKQSTYYKINFCIITVISHSNERVNAAIRAEGFT